MALLFEFVAFMTLTLSQSASVSNDTNAADTASAGEMRQSPVVRERGQPVCRTRYLYHPEEADWEDCPNFGLVAPISRGKASSVGSMARVSDLLAGIDLSLRRNTRTTNIASLSITGAKTLNGATVIVTTLGPFSAKPWCANPRVVDSRLDTRAPSRVL